MNLNDILEIEQLKYCYEQAYALHRHTEIPDMFFRSEDTVFTIPSAGDRTAGWNVINEKFCSELYNVSPREDSFHTGWQICTPVMWEDDGEICGIFPTFGFLVLSMDPDTMKPPYPVLSTLELWQDHFAKQKGMWKIHYLHAQFLLGQCVWKWNAPEDSGLAVQKKLQSIPHPILGRPKYENAVMESNDPCKTSGYSEAAGAFRSAEGDDQEVLSASTVETAHAVLTAPAVETGHAVLTAPAVETGHAVLTAPAVETVSPPAFCSAYYSIQFLQGMYTLLWQCGRFEEIPGLLFSSGDNTSVLYDGINSDTIKDGKNPADTLSFFSKVKELTDKNGGLLRIDMPADQWITISPDGKTAEGHWITRTHKIERTEDGSKYNVCIGRFSNRFCMENGSFRIQSVHWELLQEFAPYDVLPDMNLDAYIKCPADWIPRLPVPSSTPYEGASDKTSEIILLKNEIMSWFYSISYGVNTKNLFPCSSGKVCSDLSDIFRECRYALATSPVIHMNDDLNMADAFLSVSLILNNGQDEVIYSRGSFSFLLRKDVSGWKIIDGNWYPYASLEPWKVLNS